MDWGLTLAGFEHAWFCESDPYCRRVLERRYPGVHVYEDVSTLEAPERVAVLAGGFPCQDLSAAGRRAGITGERSGLWAHFARLIGELRPEYVLVENVPGLLSGGMGTVLGDLAEIGYDAEWDCLPAAAFGAPHLRARIFILAYPGGERGSQDGVRAGRDSSGSGGEALADTDEFGCEEGLQRPTGGAERQRPRDSERSGANGPRVADTEGEPVGAGLRSSEPAGERRRRSRNGSRPGGTVQDSDGRTVESRRLRWGAPQTGSAGWWAAEPDVGRVAHGVPDRLDRLAAIGNGVVPQIACWIGERILEREGVTT